MANDVSGVQQRRLLLADTDPATAEVTDQVVTGLDALAGAVDRPELLAWYADPANTSPHPRER